MFVIHHGSISFLRRLLAILTCTGVVLVICAVESCGPTGQERYQQRLARTGKPALHAVQDDRLRELMDRLDYSRTLDPPDRETEPPQRARQIAEVARAMAATARDIPEAIKAVKLGDKNREVFASLAEKLRVQALAVSDYASRKDYDGIDSSIEEMRSTCNACHSLFRAPHGR